MNTEAALRRRYAGKAQGYLEALCGVKPDRRTGSAGNREATAFFAAAVRELGYAVDDTPFACLDHVRGPVHLLCGKDAFAVRISPYSPGCDVRAELIAAFSVAELEQAACAGKILLLAGEICAEQLMPKNFAFYNPEHHRRLVALLEERQPAAIITATAKNPELVGALDPFPLIVDGDFDIPSIYCRESVGRELAALEGEFLHLKIEAGRLPSSAANVIARLPGEGPGKIVLTAHIDAYEDSPGASDNASGTAVLLLAAEMLAGRRPAHGLEIASLNGEDHYSAGGQMDYLKRYGAELPDVLLAVNIDDVGCRRGRSAYSFYGCPVHVEEKAGAVLRRCAGLAPGPPWFSGDHMLFVQHRVPALAFTAERMPELMRTVTHTAADTPDLIDPRRLVDVAAALNALVRSL
jgi:aminopeptidase YwaD